MSRKKTLSRKKKLTLLIAAATLAGGTAAVVAGTSQAAESGPADAASSVVCTGLATALSNNEQFIAGQKANPDAQSAARIANRQAVVEEIKRKQAASGCAGEAAGAQGDVAAPPGETPRPVPHRVPHPRRATGPAPQGPGEGTKRPVTSSVPGRP